MAVPKFFYAVAYTVNSNQSVLEWPGTLYAFQRSPEHSGTLYGSDMLSGGKKYGEIIGWRIPESFQATRSGLESFSACVFVGGYELRGAAVG